MLIVSNVATLLVLSRTIPALAAERVKSNSTIR